jgi:hypothetical protein
MVNMAMCIDEVTYADFDLILVGAGMVGGL